MSIDEKVEAVSVGPGSVEAMDKGDTDNDFAALQQIIKALGRVQPDHRLRVLQSVMTFFGMNGGMAQEGVVQAAAAQTSGTKAADIGGTSARSLDFSTRQSMSPKEFMKEKQPQTDVERIACLAYYVSHYRDTPHFKTLDLSKINTEAAQPKFANAAYSVNNALNSGYLAPAPKGFKQLSAIGEHFVQLLPDREAAKAAMANARTRRKARKAGSKEGKGE